MFGRVSLGLPRIPLEHDLSIYIIVPRREPAVRCAVCICGRPVELVTTEALSPFIGPRILAEAQDVLRAA
jgi:hypothetical protein